MKNKLFKTDAKSLAFVHRVLAQEETGLKRFFTRFML